MRIDHDDPVDPRGGDRVGDHCRAEGLAGRGAAILAGVAEIRYDRGHPCGAGPAAGVQQQQQFDDVVVHRWCCRLNDIDISTTDVFDCRAQLTVGVSLQRSSHGIDAEIVGNRTGKARIRTS